MLYIRMLFSLLVGLYTSRIVLAELGFENFGIYNIVGGVVVLFSFINKAMTSATQRFLTFELGKKDLKKMEDVFNASLRLHIFISLIIVIISETIGLYIVLDYLNIPQGHEHAALWCYEISLIIFCINIITIPYTASLIAYEKMSFYAYLSIIDILSKLCITFLIRYIPGDKLIIYSCLLLIQTLLNNLILICYCKNKFTTCSIHKFSDKSLYKNITHYSGWTMLGSTAVIASNQGVNIVINRFAGVVINAALAIANNVSGQINGFVGNFQMAFNPQIVKNYASKEIDEMHKMLTRTSKISFILMWILSLPIIININFVLKVWLKEYPTAAPAFCIATIAYLLIDALSGPFVTAIGAVGKMKFYQIGLSIIIFVNLPIAYILLYYGYSPIYCLIARVILNFCALVFRLQLLEKYISYSFFSYLYTVLLRTLIVIIPSVLVMKLLEESIPGSSFLNFFTNTVIGSIINIILCYFYFLTKEERKLVHEKVISKFYKKNGRQ